MFSGRVTNYRACLPSAFFSEGEEKFPNRYLVFKLFHFHSTLLAVSRLPIHRVAYLGNGLVFHASRKCIYLLFSRLVFRWDLKACPICISRYLLACKFPTYNVRRVLGPISGHNRPWLTIHFNGSLLAARIFS